MGHIMSAPGAVIRQAYDYSREMIADQDMYAATLADITDQEGLDQSLTNQPMVGVSAMGLLSKQSYDTALAVVDRSPDRRREAAIIGGMMLFATDVVDDEIDRAGMPVDEKFDYLEAWEDTLIDGAKPLSPNEYPVGSVATGIRVSFELAQFLHDRLSDFDRADSVAKVIDPLIRDVKDQITSPNTDEQLQLAVRVGAGCGELSAVMVELVEDQAFPEVVRAEGALGGYAECINHAYEIQEDIDEQSPSYGTIYLKQHGDTPTNRRYVKHQLVRAARQEYQEGTADLDKRQLVIVDSAKLLVDVKYRLLRRAAKTFVGRLR